MLLAASRRLSRRRDLFFHDVQCTRGFIFYKTRVRSVFVTSRSEADYIIYGRRRTIGPGDVQAAKAAGRVDGPGRAAAEAAGGRFRPAGVRRRRVESAGRGATRPSPTGVTYCRRLSPTPRSGRRPCRDAVTAAAVEPTASGPLTAASRGARASVRTPRLRRPRRKLCVLSAHGLGGPRGVGGRYANSV